MPLTTSTTTSTRSLRETLEASIGPELAEALEKKGFERLTPVQEAVLAPALAGKDLRISSQTGSGKTVAIGLALRHDVAAHGEEPREEFPSDGNERGRDQRARPRALVVTPTRELAKQVEEELAWLYAPRGARVASVTGGSGYRDELRAFRAKPAIVVGTPGRLLDHLKRGAIDASAAGSIVLDEADRMLDMGFREDLEAILGYAPADHRTHLVSATFPREVRALADRVQKNAVPVEGTPLGTANLDIEHLVHIVTPRERLAAIINLLLEKPGAQTLIFARTRAGVAELTDALMDAGFNVAMLSGEMEQAERVRALAAFKRGNVDALVATDVAARGIDVQDVTRVIHAEPPDDADAYTHRSGRTGRAGRKGTSSVLAATNELGRVTALLGRARVHYQFAPVPAAETIRDARDENMFSSLVADFIEGESVDARSLALAERIIGATEPIRAIARLVSLVHRNTQAEPRPITPVSPPAGPTRGAGAARRVQTKGPGAERSSDKTWVAFRVSWGQAHGAEPRRLVAMMCRRGKIEGRDIGAIRVGRTSSVIEVSGDVAADFEQRTSKPDPRDPRVQVRRWSEEPTSHTRGPTDHEGHQERERHPTEDRPSAPKDRPSVAKNSIPKDRSSVPKDRPSVAKNSIPKDRPSVPKDRPSVAKDSIPKDRPSVPKDRPSVAKNSIPKDRPSVAKDSIPKDGPSVPKDRPSVAKDSAPKDRSSASDDRATIAKNIPSKKGPFVVRRGPPPSKDDAKSHPRKERTFIKHGPQPSREGAREGSNERPAHRTNPRPTDDRRNTMTDGKPRPKGPPWQGKPEPRTSSKGGPPWRGGDARPKRRPPR